MTFALYNNPQQYTKQHPGTPQGLLRFKTTISKKYEYKPRKKTDFETKQEFVLGRRSPFGPPAAKALPQIKL